MVAVAAPPITTVKVSLWCTGTIKRGRLAGEPCERLLGKVPPEILDAGVEIKCDKCDKVNVFE